MKNRQWEAIHEVYTKMEGLCGRSFYLPEDLLYTGKSVPSDSQNVPASAGQEIYSADDIVRIRAEIRTHLDFLKVTLAEQFSERDTYVILYAVVAHIDEMIQTNFLRTMNLSWPLLQKELFQIDNAGDVFYEILDDILPKPQTHTFIYEVYYFCMRYGFRGRYENNPVKFAEYLKKLRATLRQDELSIAPPVAEEMGYVKQFGFPYWSYLIMAGFLLFVYSFYVILGKYL